MLFGRKNQDAQGADTVQALADIAVEAYRLARVAQKATLRMAPMDAERFAGHYNGFQRRVDAALASAGMQTVDLTGQPYSVGMAVTALNADEFDEEELVVAQMVEPVLMKDGAVLRTGSVMLAPAR